MLRHTKMYNKIDELLTENINIDVWMCSIT